MIQFGQMVKVGGIKAVCLNERLGWVLLIKKDTLKPEWVESRLIE